MANKRANGEGSFYYDEKKELYRAMLVTPAGKRITKASKNEDVVKDWLNEQRLLIGRNQHIEPSTLLLHDLLVSWVEIYAKSKVRQRTYERYTSLINHVEPLWNMPVQKLTPDNIQGLYNDLQEEGFSGETRKKVHNLIRSALDRAIINRYIQTNPANLVDTPKVARDEIQVFTSREVDLLLTQAKSNRFYPILLLAFTSGMRLGELLGIRWQDINLTTNEVHVRQTLQSTNKKGIIFEPPKTKNSKRRITIPLQTTEALKEYEKLWNESRENYPGEDDLVFVTNKHSPLSPQNFLRRFWNRLQMDVEFAMNDFIPKPMSVKKKLETILEECREDKEKKWKRFTPKNFHVIRHTYATTLLAANVPITDVSRALGHARVSTTLDIYSHAIPENSKLIADKIANALLK
ncbi:tyrosine-type recombinase/integrase [Pelosinus fermentans]|uniref:Integrase family protein n=1 Tax=Pelosinus fermentans JBW45 TaxID=1192197 RepID=I9NM57_9FIRM|nr:site-specific integrase [Pelosinus fermentans]AJQ26878.1 integrase family protein [Pelosinus fermentans JBW45]